MNELEILNQAFDIETHKKYFHNYFEVIIDENVTVNYAVPSHQEWLIHKACEKLAVARKELYELCPHENYFNVIDWLTKITDCVSVWEHYYKGNLNDCQRNKLKQLKTVKLYFDLIV